MKMILIRIKLVGLRWQKTFEDYEDPTPQEPEIVTHQCTMCGAMMRIPRPKRERYKVICAHPECGHSDFIGI
jgi:hypothetical protein